MHEAPFIGPAARQTLSIQHLPSPPPSSHATAGGTTQDPDVETSKSAGVIDDVEREYAEYVDVTSPAGEGAGGGFNSGGGYEFTSPPQEASLSPEGMSFLSKAALMELLGKVDFKGVTYPTFLATHDSDDTPRFLSTLFSEVSKSLSESSPSNSSPKKLLAQLSSSTPPSPDTNSRLRMYRSERMPLSFPPSLLKLGSIEATSRRIDPSEFLPIPPAEEAAIMAHIRKKKDRLQQEPNTAIGLAPR
jgi:hypothetical protein